MVKTPLRRTRQPSQLSLSHPSMGWQNEYWPPIEKNSESCLTVGAVTRTAGIPAYTWFKVPVSTQDSVLQQHCSVLI